MPTRKKIDRWDAKLILLWILLPLIAGAFIASFIPQPVIGLIEVRDVIDNKTSRNVLDQIEYARTHPEIRAIVLLLDSPGGTVNDTELIYLELLNIRQNIPIVAMVEGLSASGSYYVSMSSDYIVSNPSAMVGNVGVIANLPSSPIVLEDTVSTGPYKLWGSARDHYIRQIEMMKNTFIEAVLLSRGKRLNMDAYEVARGEIYPANEAMRKGLIDEVGPRNAAIEKAAALAKISHYKITSLSVAKRLEDERAQSTFYLLDENGISTGFPREPGVYFLYIPDMRSVLP